MIDSDRSRLRLADSMGCITRELNVTACLLRAERGNSLEYVEARGGGDVSGVSQRLREKLEEESEGFSLSDVATLLSCCVGDRP